MFFITNSFVLNTFVYKYTFIFLINSQRQKGVQKDCLFQRFLIPVTFWIEPIFIPLCPHLHRILLVSNICYFRWLKKWHSIVVLIFIPLIFLRLLYNLFFEPKCRSLHFSPCVKLLYSIEIFLNQRLTKSVKWLLGCIPGSAVCRSGEMRVPLYFFLVRRYIRSCSAIQFCVFYLRRTLINWSTLIEQNVEELQKESKDTGNV